MDPLLRKPGTVKCILCRGVVQYKNKESKKFISHMENEHAVYFDHEFILATCFMDDDEKTAVKKIIDSKNVDDEDEKNEINVKVEISDEDETSRVNLKRLGSTLEESSEHKTNKLARKEVETVQVDEETFGCTQCNQRFETTEHVRIHVKVMHSEVTANNAELAKKLNKKTDWYCEQCDQYFCRRDALRIHRMRKHKDEQNLDKPNRDDPAGDNKEQYIEKEKIETDKSDEVHQFAKQVKQRLSLQNHCSDCNVQFSTISNLKKHEKRFHEEKENFSCDKCALTFPSVAALENHNKWNHEVSSTGELPLVPPQENATGEASTISNTNLFQCTKCDRTFKKKEYLSKHLKYMHMEGKYNKRKQITEPSVNEIIQDQLEESINKRDLKQIPVSIDDYNVSIPEYWRAKMAELEDSIEDSSMNKGGQESVNKAAQISIKEEVRSGSANQEFPTNKYDSIEDLSKSKYFRMNSYAICSIDQYTNGETDFKDCFDLPPGWKFRYCGPVEHPEKSTHFITPDKRVIKSRLGAIEYLRLTEKYSRKELWEFATYLHVPEKRFDKLF